MCVESEGKGGKNSYLVVVVIRRKESTFLPLDVASWGSNTWIYCSHLVDMRQRIAIILLLLLSYIWLGRKAYCHVFILDEGWAEEGGWMHIAGWCFPSFCLLNPTSYFCLHSTERSDPMCIPESLCSFGLTAAHFLGSLLVYSRLRLFLCPMSTQSHMLFFFQKFVELSLLVPSVSWLRVHSFLVFLYIGRYTG